MDCDRDASASPGFTMSYKATVEMTDALSFVGTGQITNWTVTDTARTKSSYMAEGKSSSCCQC